MSRTVKTYVLFPLAIDEAGDSLKSPTFSHNFSTKIVLILTFFSPGAKNRAFYITLHSHHIKRIKGGKLLPTFAIS